jgi:hypothetical protein
LDGSGLARLLAPGFRGNAGLFRAKTLVTFAAPNSIYFIQ